MRLEYRRLTETGMSLEMCILASGSGGNCAIVRAPSGTLLLDAGIGPRTAARRLNGTGICLADVRAICLTHLDHDHFSGRWTKPILEHHIRVFCHADHFDSLLEIAPQVEAFTTCFEERFEPLPGVQAQCIDLAHDGTGCHGFVLDGFSCRIGYATDLGRVTQQLIEEFQGLD